MAEAEFMVNSRPLTFVSRDAEDPESLTPNHFLLGKDYRVAAVGAFNDTDLILRKQWRISQRLADHFWKRWLKEYVATLITRSRWHQPASPLAVGDVVVLADGDGPRNSWPLGRITAVSPGEDGQVRVVEVKTSSGTYKRPTVKIIKLDVTPEVIHTQGQDASQDQRGGCGGTL
jgi:hypothetical protein